MTENKQAIEAHICEGWWTFVWDDGGYFACSECGEPIKRNEIVAMLNEHASLQATNAALLEALENLLRCSEYKATDYCQDCVPAATKAISKAKEG